MNEDNIKQAYKIDSFTTSDKDFDFDEKIQKIKEGLDLDLESEIEECNDWHEIRGDVIKIIKKIQLHQRKQEHSDESIQDEQQVRKQLKK
ncbi:UvrD/REP helicase family protein, putative (macronuclear) [Tetrahymena thermophila SB210]|uniref:UvrD/REP helicase family protein, putative n=1 Tax=Tetrahymena thermophila (strain SB210) TaxID=312017 RepID=W7X3W2_TETTS|nr:UvrD/REP helicase family protein, putative [Tetrahymena thermophila SB210]EWS72127.1 UvrD/REP helicase family protein, putative [Tetrahymena thermophila SB210]|eukprot:XP_012655320.1 UvrD/REP helicase family protein, putative [Tetrahymena thermophila SB210]